jgi:hypothetical protein
LRVEISQDAIASFTHDKRFLIFFAGGDIDGEAAETDGNTIDHDGMAAAFEPQDGAIRGAYLKLLHGQSAVFDSPLNGGGDDGNVFGKEDFLERAIVGDLGERMAEDRIGTGPVGDFAGGVLISQVATRAVF